MTNLPAILTVDHVAERYGFKDRRAARDLIRRAGGYQPSGRHLYIRADRLDEWERSQAELAANARPSAPPGPTRKRRQHVDRAQTDAAPLAQDFWRDVGSEP